MIQGGGSMGALLTYYNGHWGSVCDDITDVNNANRANNAYVNVGGGRKVATVVCKELGYKWGREYNANAGSSVSIVVDGTSNHIQGCTGMESAFKDCASILFGSHNCGHSEDVGVECMNTDIDVAAYLATGVETSAPTPVPTPTAALVPNPSPTASPACDETLSGNGESYRGCQSMTRNGNTCQKWSSQSPHGHSRTPNHYPGKGLGSHNYCRNPDNEPTIWCYTTDPAIRWEFCDSL